MYINRKELAEEIKSLSVFLGGDNVFNKTSKESVLRIINEQPTADVVEVVRCKDCDGYDKHRRHCNYCGSLVFDDDFCSHGKRKEGAGNENA